MKLEPNIWFDEVVKTYQIISPHVHHTQVITCPDLNDELDILNISKVVKEKFPDIVVIEKGEINPLIRKCTLCWVL